MFFFHTDTASVPACHEMEGSAEDTLQNQKSSLEDADFASQNTSIEDVFSICAHIPLPCNKNTQVFLDLSLVAILKNIVSLTLKHQNWYSCLHWHR